MTPTVDPGWVKTQAEVELIIHKWVENNQSEHKTNPKNPYVHLCACFLRLMSHVSVPDSVAMIPLSPEGEASPKT